jgi:hypothetical protein
MRMSNPIIESQRAKVAEIERSLAYERAVLHGMELVSGGTQIKPMSRSRVFEMGVLRSHLVTGRASGGGKAPGQLSMHWRGVLETFFRSNLSFTEGEAAELYGNATGKDMRARDVRRRLEGYASEHKFVEIEPDGRFRVTEVAAERFGFARTPKGGKALDLDGGHDTTPPLFGDREGGEGYRTPTT